MKSVTSASVTSLIDSVLLEVTLFIKDQNLIDTMPSESITTAVMFDFQMAMLCDSYCYSKGHQPSGMK